MIVKDAYDPLKDPNDREVSCLVRSLVQHSYDPQRSLLFDLYERDYVSHRLAFLSVLVDYFVLRRFDFVGSFQGKKSFFLCVYGK